MKVYELTRLMNDHGTNPHVTVRKCTKDGSFVTYDGNLYAIDKESTKLKVNSFTIVGKGHIEIYAQ